MKTGLHIVTWDFPGGPGAIGSTLAGVGAAAEEAGLTDISVMDHWFQMEALAPATEPMMEGYTTLGFLAAHTETIRLGLLVTGVTYRYPALLAKTVATLDVLSGGRGQLGIGAAWYQREHVGLGVPFPSDGRALRDPRRGAARLLPHVERRRRPVLDQALHARGDHLQPASDQRAATAGADRGEW